ncbi:hypothetical protein FA15DRAFT_710218 [Coprinopsis marcescibilis]|uniref:BZIP domain-containing protein n=1 Tax=Coprinopsis marcescibilis TaxID=230819 RepID=A0A5C3KDI9_COPMA|nr:hypothetical protein FA15DRAFT_710218 [Coprinopsis marcescibilis]
MPKSVTSRSQKRDAMLGDDLNDIPRCSDAALRKKKNADAQAAFRARRAKYIATLEVTVTNLESVVLVLQDTVRESRKEALELRLEVDRLSRDRPHVREDEENCRMMMPGSRYGPNVSLAGYHDQSPPDEPHSYRLLVGSNNHYAVSTSIPLPEHRDEATFAASELPLGGYRTRPEEHNPTFHAMLDRAPYAFAPEERSTRQICYLDMPSNGFAPPAPAQPPLTSMPSTAFTAKVREPGEPSGASLASPDGSAKEDLDKLHGRSPRRGLRTTPFSTDATQGFQPNTCTVAVIKGYSFGTLRRTRTGKQLSEGAAKVSMDVLEARGLRPNYGSNANNQQRECKGLDYLPGP